MGTTGHEVGSGRRVESATAAYPLGFVGVCPPSPHEATPRMTKVSRGQGRVCQPQEAMGMKRYVSLLLFWKTNKLCVSSFFARWKNYVSPQCIASGCHAT